MSMTKEELEGIESRANNPRPEDMGKLIEEVKALHTDWFKGPDIPTTQMTITDDVTPLESQHYALVDGELKLVNSPPTHK